LTTHCLIVFVALDAENRPVETLSWVPMTEEDKALDRHARDLIRLRKLLATSTEKLSS